MLKGLRHWLQDFAVMKFLALMQLTFMIRKVHINHNNNKKMSLNVTNSHGRFL